MAAINEEALAHALRELPGWQRHGDSIWRTYEFDDFASATLFVNRVADATAAAGHQPDIAIRGPGHPGAHPGNGDDPHRRRPGGGVPHPAAGRRPPPPGRPGHTLEPDRPPGRHPAAPGGARRPLAGRRPGPPSPDGAGPNPRGRPADGVTIQPWARLPATRAPSPATSPPASPGPTSTSRRRSTGRCATCRGCAGRRSGWSGPRAARAAGGAGHQGGQRARAGPGPAARQAGARRRDRRRPQWGRGEHGPAHAAPADHRHGRPRVPVGDRARAPRDPGRAGLPARPVPDHRRRLRGRAGGLRDPPSTTGWSGRPVAASSGPGRSSRG